MIHEIFQSGILSIYNREFAVCQKSKKHFNSSDTFAMNLKQKIIMQKIILLLVLITFNLTSSQTKKKQILLFGSFHFENPGLDVAKVNTFDVMTDKSQKELENITNKIKKFGPDKIFVEWNYQKQAKLDTFFAKNTDSLLKNDSDERVQVALRSAKKLGHKKLYAIDYNQTDFPYDSLVKEMKKANQFDLIKKNEEIMKNYETDFNTKITKYTLTQLLLDVNKPDLSWYLQTAIKGGKTDNFVGAFLVSEWYRRNLYMYALILKLTESKDDKIMVLLGAGHTEMIREFVVHNPEYEIVELSTVLK
ncbi:DUF5694 domain-containing protein [Flavobacterium sp. LC2016-12]|uniref:DUF5694 domain-containing protein n=1 Tax=Flavobacterium sp. LC2016-12 TaxID=2783794 RepID=UPI001E305A18|nr:DUF5694 domain-containing protein [Flavobacterium sp. LC2016-12]